MRFAHLADCHIGGWRDPRMRVLTVRAFEDAIDKILGRGADFILISGDLFNTSVPEISVLKDVVRKLKELQEKGIPVYVIAGSHDFSPSGKTILEVLEEAGLCRNVVKGKVVDKKLRLEFTTDRTGAKICGMIGRKGMLERSYYENLDKEALEKEEGFKIFMFHTALSELKPKSLEKMESSPVSFLPEGFDYYAGGHVHIVRHSDLPGYRNIVYPGPLFPNNFRELEELGKGGFYFYDDGKIEYIGLDTVPLIKTSIDAEKKTPEQVEAGIRDALKSHDVKGNLILLRVEGMLLRGKTSDIDFRQIYEELASKGAYMVLRNTYALSSPDFEGIKVRQSSADEMEEDMIREHLGRFKVTGWDTQTEQEMIKGLMEAFSSGKKEGERSYDHEDRVKRDADRILGLDKV